MIIALQLIAWIVVAYVLTSAMEYFPHRWVMHSHRLAKALNAPRLAEEFEAHAILHHGRFFGPRSFSRCDDRAARYVSIDTGALYMIGRTFWIWLPVAAFSRPGAAVLFVFFAAHGAIWTAVHREMHYPAAGRWFARSRVYRFYLDYHETHHQRTGTNFNVLCPLFDQVLGTYGGHTRAA